MSHNQLTISLSIQVVVFVLKPKVSSRINLGFLKWIPIAAMDKSHMISFSWRLPAPVLLEPQVLGVEVGETGGGGGGTLAREGTLKMQGVFPIEKWIDNMGESYIT